LPQDHDVVRAKDILELTEGCALDLHAGKTMCWIDLPRPPADSRDDDFWVEGSGKRMYFHPRNGSGLAKIGAAFPDPAACRSARYITGRLRIDRLPAGTHICVRTHSGSYGDVRLDKPGGADSYRVAMTFVAWER
jgi:hypothetical protein